MICSNNSEPDPTQCILSVGQDRAGHWLVQENNGKLEGRFVSFAAALAFARSERHSLPGASVVVVETPLVPIVPFVPVAAGETAQRFRIAA